MKVTVTILDERLNVKVSTSKIEVPVYHKVTNGGPEQIQSDFEQTDETAVDFIKNKPTIDDTVTEDGQNAVKSSGIWTWAKGLFTPKDPDETEADTLTDESVFQFWKGELKKITWANIKAALRTYFDTIYSTFSGSYNDLYDKPTIPSNAAQITVSEPVTPDFTPVALNDNLQEVTNKVAGVQEYNGNIISLVTTTQVETIVVENDKYGKPLNIPFGKTIRVTIESMLKDALGTDMAGRLYMYVNNQSTGWARFTSSQVMGIEAVNNSNIWYLASFTFTNVGGNVLGDISVNSGASTASYAAVSVPFNNLGNSIGTINKIVVGTRVANGLGIGTKLYIEIL